MTVKIPVTIFVHAFIGWALCGATMEIGMATMPLHKALIVHAIAAAVYFSLISLSYFKKFNYTAPLYTAIAFVGLVMTLDFFVVALAINRSLAMFASLPGTWLPFALIFSSTYLTGIYLTNLSKHDAKNRPG
jgi:hypothetical protein